MISLLSSEDVKCLEKAGPVLCPHPIQRFDESLLSLKGSFLGRVVKSFQHAVWVESQGSERLLTILHKSRHLVPFGFVWPEEVELPKSGYQVEISGRQVKISGPELDDKIYFLKGEGTNLAGSKMSGFFSQGMLDSQMKHLFELLPPEGKAFLNCGDRAFKGDRAIKSDGSNEDCTHSGLSVKDRLERLLARRVMELSRMLTGWRVPDEDELRASSLKLLGLGGGLTPTGDDLLVAAAAFLKRLEGAGDLSFKRGREIHETGKRYRKCLSGLPFEKTTIAGGEMLRWAAVGVFAEPIVELVECLGRPGGLSGELELLEQKGNSLLRMGGRSGRDVLCGLIVLIKGLC